MIKVKRSKNKRNSERLILYRVIRIVSGFPFLQLNHSLGVKFVPIKPIAVCCGFLNINYMHTIVYLNCLHLLENIYKKKLNRKEMVIFRMRITTKILLHEKKKIIIQ